LTKKRRRGGPSFSIRERATVLNEQAVMKENGKRGRTREQEKEEVLFSGAL